MTKLLFDLFLNYGKIEKNCVILCVVVTTASVRLMLLIYAQDRKLIHASDLQRSFELKARSDDDICLKRICLGCLFMHAKNIAR